MVEDACGGRGGQGGGLKTNTGTRHALLAGIIRVPWRYDQHDKGMLGVHVSGSSRMVAGENIYFPRESGVYC